MPGTSNSAVHTFLSREASKSISEASCIRVAPGLYWVPPAHGKARRPAEGEVLAAYAGTGWGFAGHTAGCRTGWLTHLTKRIVSAAVVGRPGAVCPMPRVRLCGRANERRRLLNPIEITYIEAISFFDACPEVDWAEALRTGRRARVASLSQFVKTWAHRPADRDAMCARVPFGPNRLDLVRMPPRSTPCATVTMWSSLTGCGLIAGRSTCP